MTQSSLAVSVDGENWLLINASPDVREQLARTPALGPVGLRGSRVRAVVLTNGDVDHVAGLLTLREGTAFEIFATAAIMDVLDENPIFGVVSHAPRRTVALDRPFYPLAGLTVTAFAVPGKVPLYREGDEVDTRLMGEQTVGLRIEGAGRSVLHVPGCADVPDLPESDLLLFDGTVWADDDMARSGTGGKTGARMGHMAMTASIRALASRAGRKIFVHINNTNPVLLDGPERTALLASGWEVAFDGMEIRL